MRDFQIKQKYRIYIKYIYMNIKNIQTFFLLLACILLSGCKQNNLNRTEGIASIDVVNNLGKYHAITISEIVPKLDYIPLETTNDCLIGEARFIAVTPRRLFVAGTRYCYTFDRTGRFIGKIGSIGQGPGEYQSISGLCIDEKTQSLYLKNVRTILEYSWDGTFRQSIPIPKNMIESPLDMVSFVRDTLFLGHVPNYSGSEVHNFLLFDKSGQVVKSFDNHVQLNRAKPMYFFASDCSMRSFRISENVYVKENANDTLYCFNERNELIPQFVFDLGKYVFSKERREDGSVTSASSLESMRGIIQVPDDLTPMVGTSSYLFFNIVARGLPHNISLPEKRETTFMPPPGFQRTDTYEIRGVFGLYDKGNTKTRLLDTDPVSRKQGLINDIDGGLSFWPKYYNASGNELIDVWQSYDMKEILTEEYFAAHEIKNPQAHRRLRELLKNLKEDDNPVIVVGKLK